MLIPMEQVLQNFQYLMGNRLSWVDVAIFPFIRQFSMVDPNKFEQLPIPAVKKWLNQQLGSELFDSVMQKHPTWKD
jgi:glutathione S-transferase